MKMKFNLQKNTIEFVQLNNSLLTVECFFRYLILLFNFFSFDVFHPLITT